MVALQSHVIVYEQTQSILTEMKVKRANKINTPKEKKKCFLYYCAVQCVKANADARAQRSSNNIHKALIITIQVTLPL